MTTLLFAFCCALWLPSGHATVFESGLGGSIEHSVYAGGHCSDRYSLPEGFALGVDGVLVSGVGMEE